MFKMLKNIIFILLLTVFCCTGYCSDLQIFTETREIEVSKSFRLTVEVNESITDFKMPKMPDFVVILKNTNKKNGKIIYNYELTPKEEGIFTIPSISCGQTTTIPISIRVYKGQTEEDVKYSYKDSNSIASAVLDTNIVYVNQVVYYTLRFKTNRDLMGNPTYVLPMFQDFWKSKSKNKSGYQLINGENYFTFEVTTPLYPIRDGVLSIDPSSVTIQYLNSVSERKFETEKVNLKVLPLPEFGKPKSFSGSVGKYVISAKVSKTNLKVNEPLVLTITIRGNGNINSVSEPQVNLADDIKKYSTTVKTNTDDIISSKQFQCVLIPLMEGEKTIPEITFSYFDPDLKEYRELSTKPIIITVSGEKAENVDNIEDILDKANKESQEDSPTVTGFELKTKIDSSDKSKILIKNKFLISFICLLILLMIASLVYRVRWIIISRDVVRVRKMKYAALFAKCVQQVQVSLNKEMQLDFYCNMNLALKLLLSSKTGNNYILMTKDEIKDDLCLLKYDEQILDAVLQIFTDCNKFKFTCFKSTKNRMKETFDRLKFIKEQLDKKL